MTHIGQPAIGPGPTYHAAKISKNTDSLVTEESQLCTSDELNGYSITPLYTKPP